MTAPSDFVTPPALPEEVLDKGSPEYRAHCRQKFREACESEIIALAEVLPRGTAMSYWKFLDETRQRSLIDAAVNRLKDDLTNFDLDNEDYMQASAHVALLDTVEELTRRQVVQKEHKRRSEGGNVLLRKAIFNQQSQISPI